jgi:hypothetical protein
MSRRRGGVKGEETKPAVPSTDAEAALARYREAQAAARKAEAEEEGEDPKPIATKDLGGRRRKTRRGK